VAGGLANNASGASSAIPGGLGNVAGGSFSFAAGRTAKVRDAATVGGGDTDGDQGAFVWADSTTQDFTSIGPNEFAARATGGFRFVTAVDGTTGAPTQTFSITSAGKVGINTTTPEATGTMTVKDANGPTIFLQNTVNNAVESGRIRFAEFVAGGNCAGGNLHYDGNANVFHIGVHNLADCIAGNDIDVINIRRTGRFRGLLAAGSASFPLTVGADTSNGNGAHLTTGGVWTNGSSRGFKEGFVPVDARDVLAKVVALPIATWRYRGPDAARHMGRWRRTSMRPSALATTSGTSERSTPTALRSSQFRDCISSCAKRTARSRSSRTEWRRSNHRYAPIWRVCAPRSRSSPKPRRRLPRAPDFRKRCDLEVLHDPRPRNAIVQELPLGSTNPAR